MSPFHFIFVIFAVVGLRPISCFRRHDARWGIFVRFCVMHHVIVCLHLMTFLLGGKSHWGGALAVLELYFRLMRHVIVCFTFTVVARFLLGEPRLTGGGHSNYSTFLFFGLR